MMKDRLEKKIPCPWCERGTVIGSEDAKGRISVVCSKCGRCFIADLETCKGERASPIGKRAASQQPSHLLTEPPGPNEPPLGRSKARTSMFFLLRLFYFVKRISIKNLLECSFKKPLIFPNKVRGERNSLGQEVEEMQMLLQNGENR